MENGFNDSFASLVLRAEESLFRPVEMAIKPGLPHDWWARQFT